MAEVSSIAYISLNQLNDPTAINLLEAGDTIASSILPENVRNAASGFDAASATLKADIDDVSGDLNTVSAVVDGLSVSSANIPSNVSGAWQEGYQYVFDNSANIEDASSTINTFSGNVETSVVTINNSLIAGAAGLAALTTSSSELSGFIDQVSGAVDDLRASSADLSAAIDYVSANAGGGPGTIDSGVSGPWQEATDFINDSSANIIDASSTFNTFSGNIEASANDLSGFIDQVSGAVDGSSADLQSQIDDIVTGGIGVDAAVSGNWENAYTGWAAASANAIAGSDGFLNAQDDIIEVSSGFSTFSGNVETSVATLDSEMTAVEGDITSIEASTHALNGTVNNLTTALTGGYGGVVQDRLYHTAYNGTSGSVIAAAPAEQLLRCTDPSTVTVYNFTSGTSATLEVSGDLNACAVKSELPLLASGVPYPAPFSYLQLSSTGTLLLSGTWYDISNGASSVNPTYAEQPKHIESASGNGVSWNYLLRQFEINEDGVYEIECNINHYWQVATTDSLKTHSFRILNNGVTEWDYLSHPQLTQTESREAVSFKVIVTGVSGTTLRVQCQNNGDNATLIGGPGKGSTVMIRRIG